MKYNLEKISPKNIAISKRKVTFAQGKMMKTNMFIEQILYASHWVWKVSCEMATDNSHYGIHPSWNPLVLECGMDPVSCFKWTECSDIKLWKERGFRPHVFLCPLVHLLIPCYKLPYREAYLARNQGTQAQRPE